MFIYIVHIVIDYVILLWTLPRFIWNTFAELPKHDWNNLWIICAKMKKFENANVFLIKIHDKS